MTRTTGSPTTPLNGQHPIPIPMRVRWARFRYQLLPVLTLLVCSVLAGWLWFHQTAGGRAVGAVQIVQMPVTSTVQGLLGYLPGKQVEVFDKVSENDVVAMFDPAPFQAR